MSSMSEDTDPSENHAAARSGPAGPAPMMTIGLAIDDIGKGLVFRLTGQPSNLTHSNLASFTGTLGKNIA